MSLKLKKADEEKDLTPVDAPAQPEKAGEEEGPTPVDASAQPEKAEKVSYTSPSYDADDSRSVIKRLDDDNMTASEAVRSRIPHLLKNRYFDRIRYQVDIFFQQEGAALDNKNIVKGIGGVVGALVFVYVAVVSYNYYLFYQGKRAFDNHDYTLAQERLLSYYEDNETDNDAALLLVKAHLYGGDTIRAKALLSKLEISAAAQDILNNPVFFLYRSILAILEKDIDGIRRGASAGLAIDENYIPGRYVLDIGSYLFNPESSQLLDSWDRTLAMLAKLSDDEKEVFSENVNEIRQLVFKNFNFSIVREAPLPFERLSKPTVVDKALGFSLPVAGFYNAYYFTGGDAQVQTQRLTLEENIILMQALIAIQQGNLDVINERMRVVNNIANPSAFLLYLRGYYLAVIEKNFTAAALVYEQIVADYPENIHARIMYANAVWAGSLGAFPTDKHTEAYNAALKQSPDNFIALNNRGFLYIYQGDLDNARTLLSQAWEKNSNDIRIAINLVFLDIVASRFLAAEEKLYGLLATYPDSDIVLSTLLQVLLFNYKYTDGINLLEDIKARHPERKDFHLKIARIYRDTEQSTFAINTLRDALGIFADDKEVIIELLLEYAISKKISDYRKFFIIHEDVISASTDNYRILLAQALVARSVRKSSSLYAQALIRADSHNDKVRVIYHQARDLMKRSSTKDALEFLNFNTSTVRESEKLQSLVFFLHAETIGKEDEDIKKDLLAEVNNFIETEHLSPVSRVNVAQALLILGEPKKAIDFVQTMGNVRYDLNSALVFLHAAYIAVDDAKKAKEINTRLGVKPSDPNKQERAAEQREETVILGVSSELTRALNKAVSQGNYEDVVRIYTEIIDTAVRRKEPELTYQNRGAAYLVLENYQAAASDFSRALGYGDVTDENKIAIHHNYGYALAKLEKWGDSEAQLKAVLTLDPQNLDVAYLLANVQYQLQKFDEVIETYNALLALYPKELKAYKLLARAYLIVNKNEDVVRVLNEALEIDSLNGDLHRFLAEVYVSIGQAEKAKKHLNIVKRL